MKNNQQKRYSTDIKAGSIFLTRKLFFAYRRTKAYMVVCLTKQGQYALIYKDKTRQEQMAFFNIKNCVIRREEDNQSRVIVDFQISNSARRLQFEARDLEDAESWVQAFTGKQISRVHALTGKQESRVQQFTVRQDSRVNAHTIRQDSRVNAHTIRQDSRVNVHTVRQESRVNAHTVRQESRVNAFTERQDSRVQTTIGGQESLVHAFTGRQESVIDKTKKIPLPCKRNSIITNLADKANTTSVRKTVSWL